MSKLLPARHILQRSYLNHHQLPLREWRGSDRPGCFHVHLLQHRYSLGLCQRWQWCWRTGVFHQAHGPGRCGYNLHVQGWRVGLQRRHSRSAEGDCQWLNRAQHGVRNFVGHAADAGPKHNRLQLTVLSHMLYHGHDCNRCRHDAHTFELRLLHGPPSILKLCHQVRLLQLRHLFSHPG